MCGAIVSLLQLLDIKIFAREILRLICRKTFLILFYFLLDTVNSCAENAFRHGDKLGATSSREIGFYGDLSLPYRILSVLVLLADKLSFLTKSDLLIFVTSGRFPLPQSFEMVS